MPSLGEVAQNTLIYSQLMAVVKRMGYVIQTNKARSTLECSNVSFSSSWPDLIIYHPKQLLGCVINSTPDSEGGDGESGADTGEPVTLVGAVTEHKQGSGQFPLGQLLGNMEKVAGDLGEVCIRDTERIFDEITVYGLIVNLQQRSCTAHKLSMRFEHNQSTLHSSEEETALNDGLNRLLHILDSYKWFIRYTDSCEEKTAVSIDYFTYWTAINDLFIRYTDVCI